MFLALFPSVMWVHFGKILLSIFASLPGSHLLLLNGGLQAAVHPSALFFLARATTDCSDETNAKSCFWFLFSFTRELLSQRHKLECYIAGECLRWACKKSIMQQSSLIAIQFLFSSLSWFSGQYLCRLSVYLQVCTTASSVYRNALATWGGTE